MLKTRVIPCLLLRNKGLVKTVKFKDPKYVGDPFNAVKIFNDKEVDELIFLDITATTESRKPNFKLISEIASECFMPFGYGGGISTVEEVQELFNLGVEKVVINSKAAENPDFIESCAQLFGSQSIVVSIDVKKSFFGKYEVHTRSGTKNIGADPTFYARQMENAGAGEIFLNSMDRDGTMQGFDLALIRKVSESVRIPLVACGGAGTLEHLNQAISEGNASAVSAGSMFVFHGKHRAVLITYPSTEEIGKLLSKKWEN
jgi:imidazole glycerol-phosphate synthase subunit HisF